MHQVWKIPLRSRREDFERDPTKVDRARAYCFENRWVGIGWEIDHLDDGLADPLTYEQALPSEYPNALRAALSAHRSISSRMLAADFVWCRSRDDIYWLGRICGDWRYRNVGEFREFDLFQVRECQWLRIGSADAVPGIVKNAYAGRGSAISRMNNQAEALVDASVLLWQGERGLRERRPQEPSVATLLAFGHSELEDIVGLYLQMRLGWYIVPSTAKRSTPTTEFVLRNVSGQRAFVQVKSGHTRVETNIRVPEGVDAFYIFDLAVGTDEQLPTNVTRISPTEILTFITELPFLIPAYLR